MKRFAFQANWRQWATRWSGKPLSFLLPSLAVLVLASCGQKPTSGRATASGPARQLIGTWAFTNATAQIQWKTWSDGHYQWSRTDPAGQTLYSGRGSYSYNGTDYVEYPEGMPTGSTLFIGQKCPLTLKFLEANTLRLHGKLPLGEFTVDETYYRLQSGL